MTGNHKRDGVAVVRHSDGAAGGGPSDRFGDLPVAPRLPIGNAEQGPPDALLKRRPGGMEREQKFPAGSGEILAELLRRKLGQRTWTAEIPGLSLKMDGGDSFPVIPDDQKAEWGLVAAAPARISVRRFAVFIVLPPLARDRSAPASPRPQSPISKGWLPSHRASSASGSVRTVHG